MISRSGGEPISGRLLYQRSESSFDVVPKPARGVASLLVNDIQIEIDEDGRLVYVWGFCPQESWASAIIQPREAVVGRLRYEGAAVVAGVSRRLNAGKPWMVLHDRVSRWLCIGDHLSEGEPVAFAPRAVAMLNCGEIKALWLRPEIVA